MDETMKSTKLRIFCAALFGILALFGCLIWEFLVIKYINFLFLLFGHTPYGEVTYFISAPFMVVYAIISFMITICILGKDLLDSML